MFKKVKYPDGRRKIFFLNRKIFSYTNKEAFLKYVVKSHSLDGITATGGGGLRLLLIS